jgi:hypothetical protein
MKITIEVNGIDEEFLKLIYDVVNEDKNVPMKVVAETMLRKGLINFMNGCAQDILEKEINNKNNIA